MNNTTTIDDDTEHCRYNVADWTNERFWLVTVFGSSISIISIIENTLLFTVFVSNRRHLSSPSLYLLLLSLVDLFMSISYIMIMSTKLLIDYMQLIVLKRIWMFYIVPMMAISHVAMTTSSFLILSASIERYCLTVATKYVRFMQKYRIIIAFCAIALGLISKGSVALELQVVYQPECENQMTEYVLAMGSSSLVRWKYYTIWRFWYRNIVTILLPFFLLAYFNICIVYVLRKSATTDVEQIQSPNERKMSCIEHKARVRAASRTLVLVVCTYLISNTLAVIITIWEHLDKNSLFEHYLTFYIFSVDIVSLLTIVASASRLPIFLTCMPVLRLEIMQMLDRLHPSLTISSLYCCVESHHDQKSIATSNNADSDEIEHDNDDKVVDIVNGIQQQQPMIAELCYNNSNGETTVVTSIVIDDKCNDNQSDNV